MADKPDAKRPTHRRPTAEQMDERIIVPLEPEEFLEGVLKAGPHPGDDREKVREPNKKKVEQ